MSRAEAEGSLYDIAVVGLAARFPGARDVAAFWRNLRDGVESVSFFSDEELEAAGVAPSVFGHPSYVKAGAILDDVELFDASFFGFSPREAELMDPQHRLFLECAWEALERAGYDADRFDGAIGVYAGGNLSSYLLFNIHAHRGLIESVGGFPTRLANDKDFLATRTSYKLNLRGPSITVQTACSTSLVAMHMACQSLLSRESDMALAGGVSVMLPQKAGYMHQEGMIFSPDGHCRAFDARAQGTLGGNGAGVVVLKRLDDALRDGDTIHAIIKGSAINNDGALKVGFTAPSVTGQAAVITEALALADVDPSTVSYVEAHGSGTPLGDPIEVAALSQAFRARTDRVQFCAIGSVKTNIGHLDAAAGAAGVIKTILALEHGEIPPSLHFTEPNPQIDFERSPFYVNTKLAPWKTADGGPRRAGVSSFGMGGTNAHIVLEEAPPREPSGPSRAWQILTLSAKTAGALEKITDNAAQGLAERDSSLPDVAYTYQVGRREFHHRRVVVCTDEADAISVLRGRDPRRILTAVREDGERPVVFMLSGLGDHYLNMGRELYETETVFREELDRCCEMLEPHLGVDLREVIYPAPSTPAAKEANGAPCGIDFRAMVRGTGATDPATARLNRTVMAQPAMFVVEYALAKQWMAWGIRPKAMIGYSLGEYVAACLAGVLSLEDALMLVAKRARLIQELPAGSMLAVSLTPNELESALGSDVSLAAVNGPSLSVLAGTPEAITKLEEQFAAKGIVCRRLPTTHAFHTTMMDPIAAALTTLTSTVSLKAPVIPFISNVSGGWITPEEATSPAYWAEHLCRPVRFGDGLDAIFASMTPVLLEIGPGQSLSSLALQQDRGGQRVTAFPSLRNVYDRQPDLAFLLNTLGQLWLQGVSIDWQGFYAAEHRGRVPLPTYPFERERYWIDPPKFDVAEADRGRESAGETSLAARRIAGMGAPAQSVQHKLEQWFYVPSWKQSALSASPASPACDDVDSWLVFTDDIGLGDDLAERLRHLGKNVVTVTAGSDFARLDDRHYRVSPASPRNYDVLIKDLRARDLSPRRIAHLWGVSGDSGQAMAGGFLSLVFLAQALRVHKVDSEPVRIWAISDHLQPVESTDIIHPEKALSLGAVRVIPQEMPSIACRSIDVRVPAMGRDLSRLVDRLLAEMATATSDVLVAYRGHRRWVQTFDPLVLEARSEVTSPETRPLRLREGGVYLITGGTTEIGKTIGAYLAKTVRAHVVLMDSVDIADEQAMHDAIDDVEERLGPLNGVIHAAGDNGEESFRALSELDEPECERQLRARVLGLVVLERILRTKEVDFVLVQSSLSSVLGGLGLAAHTAANAFMDAFVHQQAEDDRPWFTIDWDAWRAPVDGDPPMRTTPGTAIDPEEGARAIHLIFSSAAATQIIVSTRDLHTRLEQWVQRSSAGGVPAGRHARPDLPNPYVAPSTETEEIVSAIWEELLGVAPVGTFDNFLQLGGHSLLGTQVVARMRQTFQVDLPLRAIFEDPTVSGLSIAVEDLLIAELEALSDEHAAQLLEMSR